MPKYGRLLSWLFRISARPTTSEMVATGPMWLVKIQIPVPQPHKKDSLVRPTAARVSRGELFQSRQFVWVVLLSHPVTSEITNVRLSLFELHVGGAYPH